MVAVRWYLRYGLSYRDIEEHDQVIDVLVSARRDAAAARRLFRRALKMLNVKPTEVVTDAASIYPAVLDELIPSAWHHVEQYANIPIEADHGQLKHRLLDGAEWRTATWAERHVGADGRHSRRASRRNG